MKNKYSKLFSIKSIFIFLLITGFSRHLYAQQKTVYQKLNLAVSVNISDSKSHKAEIDISSGDKSIHNYETAKRRMYVPLDMNTNYVITASKDGYIAKQVTVDTHVPAGRDTTLFGRFELVFTLNAPPKDTTATYLHPVAAIKYDNELKDFALDSVYNKSELAHQLAKTRIIIYTPSGQEKPPR